jgi:hypothetical protein
MKTVIALIGVARSACSLIQCAYSSQVAPFEYQFGSGL